MRTVHLALLLLGLLLVAASAGADEEARRRAALVGTWHITSDNVDVIRDELARNELNLVSIIPDHFTSKVFAKGAFTAKDEMMAPSIVWCGS